MNYSIGNNNNINESQKLNNITIHQNQKLLLILRNFLDYLPNTLIKLIFEKNIINENSFAPLEYKSNSCFLYIDISEIKEDYINNKCLNKERYEYIYTYINKYLEELIAIISDLGCDFFFFGTGILCLIPPDFDEETYIEIDKSKIFNKILKMIQCAIEIKNKFFQFRKCFKVKIGLNYGEYKIIILNNKVKSNINNDDYKKNQHHSFNNLEFLNNEKNDLFMYSNRNLLFLNSNSKGIYYYYFLQGKTISDCCEFAKLGEEGQITIDQFIYNYISEYFEIEEIEQNLKTKLYKVNKRIQSLKMQSKIINNNKLNYSDKQIISKKDIILDFFPNYIFKTISEKGYIINGKWFKETKYITILMLRPLIRKQDLNTPEKYNQLIKQINKLLNELGGIIFKIMNDEKGIIIMIVFGIKKFMSINKDELISVIFAFEITKKLKEINIYPHIAICSNLALFNSNKYSGGRKDFNIIGNAYFDTLQCLEETDNLFGTKNIGEDAIIIDKNTMDIIDSIIPCRYLKKLKNNYMKNDIYLFLPLKLNKTYNINKKDNIIPLLGPHLHFFGNNNEEDKEEIKYIEDKNYSNFYDKNEIIHFANLLKNILEKNAKIKLININGFIGSGKTLFLSECLNSFFRYYPILKDILYYNNIKNEFPFLFFSNLQFVMYSKSYNEYSKKEFKAIQPIFQEIFSYLFEEVNEKYKIINLIKKNKCLDYLNFLVKFFGENELKMIFENQNNEDKSNLKLMNKEDLNNIFSLFIELINQYSIYINNINKDKINLYNIKIPIIILIESINIMDKYSFEFLKFFLENKTNLTDLIIITTNSIPIFPQYISQKKHIINPFYKLKNNPFLYQYEISTLNCKEKMNSFVKTLFNEKRNLLIDNISDNIINFLIVKTYGGIQEYVIKLIIYLYDNKYIIIKTINEKIFLIENEDFEIMLKQNDFIDLIIPYNIEKNINYIISNELTIDEISLLRICAVLGDLFDTVKLNKILKYNSYSYINTLNDYWKKLNNGSSKEFDLYEKILELEEKNIIEILFDIQVNHKFVVCKFSVPFMREVLYQCISLEQRNELHYIIGKIIKNKIDIKSDYIIYKYDNDELELIKLKKHLRKMEIFMHDYYTRNINKFESINNKYEENFSLNNLKTIIIMEISTKLVNSNNNKNTLIKSGYLEKKGDGKITWEKRFFILTPNKLSYYYLEDDYKLSKEPLGYFYLRNLYDVRVLRNNGKYIFCLTVNEWIKKKELMTERIYVLSSKKWEDLYSWTISLKILKIKAFYDNFCYNFCFVTFPLFEAGNIEKSELTEYVFKIKIDSIAKRNKYNTENNNSNNDVLEKRQLLNERTNVRKLSLLSNPLGLNLKETDLLVKRTYHLFLEIIFNYFRFIFRYSFSTILKNIQIKINNNINIKGFDFFDSFIIEKYQIQIKKFLDKMNFNNDNLKKKIEEEKKNIFIYSDKYKSEDYSNYLKKYCKTRKYNEPIQYKTRDLKKISDYNKIITTKNYDEIEFIDEYEVGIKKEDNLRFGDYADITSPYPLSKFSSNNNIFINNEDFGKRKRSITVKHKGETGILYPSYLYEDRDKCNSNDQNELNPILPSFLNKNNNEEKKSYDNNLFINNNNEILNKKNTISHKSIFSKKNENEVESIKKEVNNLQSIKNNKSNGSSSLSSSVANNKEKEEISNRSITNEKTIINMEYNYSNKKNNDKSSSELTKDKEDDFNFGELLKDYAHNMKLKRKQLNKNKERIFKKYSKKNEKKEKTNKIKDNKSKKSVKEENDINKIENKTLEKSESRNSFNSIDVKSDENKNSNDINCKNSKNNKNSNNSKNIIISNKNSNKNNISKKAGSSISNKQSKKNELSFSYGSKNNSFKNIIIKNSNGDKKKIESKKSEKDSIYIEEEPSQGNINCNIQKFGINNNSFIINTSITDRNNYSNVKIDKKDKKVYNPYLISFFSKDKQPNQTSNKLTNRENIIPNKKIKINENLKLWLMLNKNNKTNNNIEKTNNNIEKTSLDKEKISNCEIIGHLNESYSYIKNFIFDNYHDTQKRCQLRKKVLFGLNSKSMINNKKYKNNHLEMIQKLKNKSISLDQEKEYIGAFKDILHQNKIKTYNNYYKANINTSRSKASNNNDSSTNNNTYRENFYYPDVFYLNENDNLHKKKHVSYLFSKLKTNNKLK